MPQLAYRVEQPQLEGENDPVRHFDEPIHLLHVFEPFQMQGQDRGEALYPHAFLGRKEYFSECMALERC